MFCGKRELETIRRNRYIATPRRARVAHKCVECGWPVVPGETYYSVSVGGAGVAGFLEADAVHPGCLHCYFESRELEPPLEQRK